MCTACGAEANASCNCGTSYAPKAVLAREAVEANPEKSNRAIADEIGVDEKTVRKARADRSAPESVTGKDGKSYPARRLSPQEDGSLEEKIFSGTANQADVTEWRKRERERMKEALPEGEDHERVTLGEYFALSKRASKLEKRNNELSAAFNAKEKTEGRNWPVDMTPKQIKLRDKLLKYIAWNQRDLEQLYGEVTGQPSWRVEVTTKDGARLGTGARFGTRAEAEFYNTHFAASRLGDDYASSEIISCKKERANVEIDGDTIRFAHGDCVLLDWRPAGAATDDATGSTIVDNDPSAFAEAMKAERAALDARETDPPNDFDNPPIPAA